MLQIGLIASFFALFGQIQASIILKACITNAVMTRKDSNCVRILSDQGNLKMLQTSVNILYFFWLSSRNFSWANLVLCEFLLLC